MLQRGRLALQNVSASKLGGEVEVDETIIGGKARNMHKDRKRRVQMEGRNIGGKTIVLGMLERGNTVRTAVVPDRTKPVVQSLVRQHVERGAEIFADEHAGNWRMDEEYLHHIINHLEAYVDGNVHTNTMENFWSLLKRGLHGTYVSVEPFHLFRYVDEQAFRYNNRDLPDDVRFRIALRHIVGRRLTYQALTGKAGGQTSPEAS
jgi:hypothetical protein